MASIANLYVDIAAKFSNFDQVESKFGNLQKSVTALGQAAGLVGGAMAALGAAVVALGERGADVDDVTSAFNRLNADAPKALQALRAGVGGLLTDYELMKPLNSSFCKKELSKKSSGLAWSPFGFLTTSNTAWTSDFVI